jgi:hypothetical protein
VCLEDTPTVGERLWSQKIMLLYTC